MTEIAAGIQSSIAQPFVANHHNARGSRLMLLIRHSTADDIHGLRVLSPEIDHIIRLKFYGDSKNVEDWFAKDMSDIGKNPQAAFGAATAYTENAGPAGVSIEILAGLFQRLLVCSPDEALLYALMHCIKHNYTYQFREIIASIERIVPPAPVPIWYRAMIDSTPCNIPMLDATIVLSMSELAMFPPARTVGLKLFYFALLHEAYEVVDAMLRCTSMLESLPLSVLNRLAKHLTDRVQRVALIQQQNPYGIRVFVSADEIKKFEAQLSAIGIDGMSDSLKVLNNIQMRERQRKKDELQSQMLDEIDEDEVAGTINRIETNEIDARIEQQKLQVSIHHKQITAAREARKDALRTLAEMGVFASAQVQVRYADVPKKVDSVLRQELRMWEIFDANLKQWLKEAEEWEQREFGSDPEPMNPLWFDVMSTQAKCENVLIEALQEKIGCNRAAAWFSSLALKQLYDEKKEIDDKTTEDHINNLRERIQLQEPGGFGDD